MSNNVEKKEAVGLDTIVKGKLNGGSGADPYAGFTVGELIDLPEKFRTPAVNKRIAEHIEKTGVDKVITGSSDGIISLGEGVDIASNIDNMLKSKDAPRIVNPPVGNNAPDLSEKSVIEQVQEIKHNEPVSVLEKEDVPKAIKPKINSDANIIIEKGKDLSQYISRVSKLIPDTSSNTASGHQRIVDDLHVLKADNIGDVKRISKIKRKSIKSVIVDLPNSNVGRLEMFGLTLRMHKIGFIEAYDKDELSFLESIFDRVISKVNENLEFDDFISNVSIFDLNKLIFGLLKASNDTPDVEGLTIQCSNKECVDKNDMGENQRHSIKFNYPIEKLEVIEGKKNPENFKVNTKMEFVFENNSIEFKHISLKDKNVKSELFRMMLEKMDDDSFPNDEQVLFLSLFVENIVEYLGLDDDGKPIVAVYEDVFSIYKQLFNTPNDELLKMLTEKLEVLQSEFTTSYNINGIKCDKCGKTHNDISIGLRDLLFETVVLR